MSPDTPVLPSPPSSPIWSEAPDLLISGHAQAPLFSGPDRNVVLKQVLNEVASGNFDSREAFVGVFRQAGLVNLWFFLKYIAGYSGAYNKLTRYLHVEMCNFRQGNLAPGSRDACFVPRSSYKSTCNTHGAHAWEIVREPEIRVGLFSSVAERAKEWFSQTQKIFEDNALFAELYPEFVPRLDKGSRWTANEMVVPCRQKAYPEANLKWFTAGGSTQGIHVDLATFDDLVGDNMLNADHGATADMISMGNWFKTNRNTLLQNPVTSRVFLSATRYGIDDPYEDVMLNSRVHTGYWDEVEQHYPVVPGSEWRTYYRMAEQFDQSIFPEAYPIEFLRRIEASDPWTYNTQYKNYPLNAGAVEFAHYHVGGFDLEYDASRGYTIVVPNSGECVALADCDLIQAVDPAGSEKFVSVRTSRTSHVVLARDCKNRKFILEIHAGFVPTTRWFDWIFQTKDKYAEWLRKTYVEQQAGFKALTSIIQKEQKDRGKSLSHEAIPALGDKIVTIRNILQPELEKGLLFVNEAYRKELDVELKSFPASSRRDVLDALKIAVKYSKRPEAPEERTARRENRITGGTNEQSRVTAY